MGGEGGADWGPLVALSAAGARRPGTHCCFGTGGQVIDGTGQILKQMMSLHQVLNLNILFWTETISTNILLPMSRSIKQDDPQLISDGIKGTMCHFCQSQNKNKT